MLWRPRPVHYTYGRGSNRSANVNSATGKTDFAASLEQLTEELPNAGGVSLVVSWFGNDLRCGACTVQPKVEQKQYDGQADGVEGLGADAVPRHVNCRNWKVPRFTAAPLPISRWSRPSRR